MTAIAAGFYDSLALKSDSRAVLLGLRRWRELRPVHGPGGGASGVTAIAAGGIHGLALKPAASSPGVAASADDFGQCTVPALATSDVTAIAAGGYHSLALKGGQRRPRLGLRRRLRLRPVLGAARGIEQRGRDRGRLRRQPGAEERRQRRRLGLRGGFDYGQCPVPAGRASGVVAVAAGAYHSLALKSDGSVIAWGCGAARTSASARSPAGAASGVVAIAAAAYHSLALKSDGSVVAWGCGAGENFGQCTVLRGGRERRDRDRGRLAHSLA